MKKRFLHITSILMAVVVLLSTFSFSISKHFCGDHLVEVAVFSELKGCGMGMDLPNQVSIEKTCCKNDVVSVEGQDELKIQFDHYKLDQISFVTAFISSYFLLFVPEQEQNIFQDESPPPKIIRCIYKLDETYLI
ncbi:HYC_CC_PP family protein [Aegicerativicinus sediminis]